MRWSSILLFTITILTGMACSHPPDKKNIKGTWEAKSGKGKLIINDKKFALDTDVALAEDYFVKGDTIFTSFEGNLPYSKFVIQKIDDHNLQLLSPDSAVLQFTKP
jgi:hypothetical protein